MIFKINWIQPINHFKKSIWRDTSVSPYLFCGKCGIQFSKAREEALNLLKEAKEFAHTVNESLKISIDNILYAADKAFEDPDL